MPGDTYETDETVIASHAVPEETGLPGQETDTVAEVLEGIAPPAADASDPYAEYGGIDAIKDALAVSAGFKTEEGIKIAAYESLVALGYNADDVAAFMQGTYGAVEEEEEYVDPFAEIGDDDVLTKADAIAMADYIANQRLNERIGPVEQQIEQEREHRADLAVQGTLQSLGVESQAQRQLVITLAQAYIQPDDWDPQTLSNAVRSGYADAMALREQDAKEYLSSKQQVRDSLPSNIGGGSVSAGSDGPEAEPQTLKEAIARARKQLNYQAQG